MRSTALGCGALTLIGVGLLLAAWLCSPIIHPFVFIIFAHAPAMISFGALIIWLALIAIAPSAAGKAISVVGALISFSFFALYVLFGTAWQYEAYLEDNQPTTMTSQPDTTGVRYIPYEIAQQVAENYATDPQAEPGEMEPFVEGDSAHWIAAREPRRIGNVWWGPQPGVLEAKAVNDIQQDPSLEFNPGMGTGFITNTLGWQEVKKDFWNDLSSQRYITRLNDGETVIVHPTIGWYYTWRYFLPTSVPYWKGVLIWRTDGSVEELSKDEAIAKYPGSRLAPYEMADYFSHAYRFKDGIMNAWFYGYDLPDKPHLGKTDSDEEDSSDTTPTNTDSNQFPFLIPTEDGPAWFTAVEPSNAKNKSLYIAYYVDATTGDPRVFKFGDNQVGPDRAAGLIEAHYQELKNAVWIEPRPIVKDDKVYWMLTNTTDQYLTISWTALVDAQSQEVYRFDSEEEVDAFIQSGELPNKATTKAEGGDSARGDSAGDKTAGEGNGQSSTSTETPTDEELVQMLRDAADSIEKK